MNANPIYMNHWLAANGRRRALPGDAWYRDFAGQLLSLLQRSSLFAADAPEVRQRAALHLALYLQDAVAQTGGWLSFTRCCRELYGRPVPLYTLQADYVPDEINPEDVSFLLWKQKSRRAPGSCPVFPLQDPFAPELLQLSAEVYDLMDSVFEEAPINEVPSGEAWMHIPGLMQASVPLPEIMPGSKLTPDVERCLEHSGGAPLLYFATYRDLCRFLVEVLKWEDHPDSLLADLAGEREFVIYANAKGMLLAPGVAACFREERNPLYNAARAAREGYRMFCEPGRCPFDLLKYGMAKRLLPDVALPFAGGKELLHREWDFLARYYLDDYYEGG